MAEAILSSAVEELVKRVGSFVAEGISFNLGFRGELQKFEESLILLQAMIQDAERKQVPEVSLRLWLEKLQDLAYDAEDVLDELAYELLRKKVESQNNVLGEVSSFFSLSNPIAFRLNMALKIEKINVCLDELEKTGIRFGLNRVLSTDRTPLPLSLNIETHSFLENSEVAIGREDDISKVVSLLSSSSVNQQALSVIPIVGMRGVGKTTLAKSVWKVIEEKKSFDEMIWVYVSDNFDDKRILGGMLQTVDGSRGSVDHIVQIITRLKRRLQRKNFFLVLDDVCNEIPEKWDNLKSCLLEISGTKKSVVIVTTHSRSVASIMETSPYYRHELKRLSDVQSWSIIRNIVSRNGRESIPLEMEDIGWDIAKKCGGVPLAARVIGGMLFSSKEKEKWLSIKHSDALNELSQNDEVLPVLKLSFDHLSCPFLKRCFGYCSIFPKDFVIEKERLIQFWMAEGLLRPSNERISDTMEDIGERYFDNFLARFFFQEVRRDEFLNITGCKMHDLVHDLALTVSKSETLVLESGSAVGDSSCVRHLNLIPRYKVDKPAFLCTRKLRTLFSRVDVLKSWKFKDLRTLDLHDACYIKKLPASIGKLKLLRYLDVSGTKIKAFPESVTSLYHLQTLRANCRFLFKLPKKLRDLVSLRHLYFPSHVQMPADLGCLVSLQTLEPYFVVCPSRGYKVEVLGCFKELRGELRIGNLELVEDKHGAERADLFGKTKIHTLVLYWSPERERSWWGNTNDEEVLEGLHAHPELRSLKIENYLGEHLPQWLLMPRLNNLVVLKFQTCSKLKHLPSLGHLHCLEILEVDGLNDVISIGKEFYNVRGRYDNENEILFPALKRFCLKRMRSLVEWMIPAGNDAAGGVQRVVFPCLKELYIHECPKLKQLPSLGHLRCLEILEVDENGWGGVSCIGKEFYDGSRGCNSQGGILFPALKRSSLKRMRSLVEWMVPAGDDAACGVHRVVFPCLKELYIHECPKLKQLQSLGHLHCLEILEVDGCGGVSCIGKGFYDGSGGCSSEDAMLFPALKSLSLKNMENLVEWMVPVGDDTACGAHRVVFPCLKELYIHECPKLKQLPSLGHLQCLEILEVDESGWDGVRYIGEEFYSRSSGCSSEDAILFPALKRFSLKNMYSLVQWMVPAGVQGAVFPCLEDLEIYDCNRLKSIPSMSCLSTQLIELKIRKCGSLTHLSGNFLAYSPLKVLSLCDCRSLASIPSVQSCTALEYLNISSCRSLSYSPDDFFSCPIQLKKLEIDPMCEGLEEYPEGILNSMHHLSESLEELTIYGWDKLKSIPHQVQHLTALKILHIEDFKGVEALPDWLGNLSSLSKLRIKWCKNLKYLPSSTTMQRLSKLKSLQILYCPLLAQNCRKGSGPEWPKISHIPHIDIRD